eukprot:9708311-Alexandrium_andersonii.AAC.1
MSASLVGSEMCIRDRLLRGPPEDGSLTLPEPVIDRHASTTHRPGDLFIEGSALADRRKGLNEEPGIFVAD